MRFTCKVSLMKRRPRNYFLFLITPEFLGEMVSIDGLSSTSSKITLN